VAFGLKYGILVCVEVKTHYKLLMLTIFSPTVLEELICKRMFLSIAN
jgi:hypothetical protein